MLNCVCTLCKHVTLLLYDETFHHRPILDVIGTAIMLRWLKQLLFLMLRTSLDYAVRVLKV